MTELAVPLRWTLGGIYGVLIAATAVTNSLHRFRPRVDVSGVAIRIRTWWAMTVAFTVALVAGPLMTMALFAIIGLAGTREFLRLSVVRERIVAGTTFAAAPIAYGLLAVNLVAAAWLAPLIIAVFVTPAAAAVAGRPERYLTNIATSGMAVLLTVWAPMHAVLLLTLPGLESPAGAAALLVFLVMCTEVNDVAQFLWGKAMGRTPIAPRVSPNKTVAGFIGGVATTAGVAALAGPTLTAFSGLAAAGVGIAIAGLGFLGDVTMSAFKRSAGVKDSGALLPGHGGVLDRIDSLIFTAPAFVVILVAL